MRETELRTILLQLALLLTIGNSALFAQDFKRFEFNPFGGFTASGSIPIESEDEIKDSIQVNSSYHLGAALGVNLNELDAIEVLWQRQFTDGRLPAVIAAPASSGNPRYFDLNIDQYHVNFLHHFKIANPKTRPYVIAGLGATAYHANHDGRNDSKSYFSFSVGGGVKYFFTSHFGFRGEARWSPSLMSTSGSNFWCSIGGQGAACEIDLKASLHNQLVLTGGLVFRF